MVIILQRRKNNLETTAQGASCCWRKTTNFPGCWTQGPKACTRAQSASAHLRVAELWPFPCVSSLIHHVAAAPTSTWSNLLYLLPYGLTFHTASITWTFCLLLHGLTFCAAGITWSLSPLPHGLIFCAAEINQRYFLYKIGRCNKKVISMCKSVLSVCPVGVDLWVVLSNPHPTIFLMVT